MPDKAATGTREKIEMSHLGLRYVRTRHSPSTLDSALSTLNSRLLTPQPLHALHEVDVGEKSEDHEERKKKHRGLSVHPVLHCSWILSCYRPAPVGPGSLGH